MQYSEYLKWSKGLSVIITKQQVDLLIYALYELKASEPSVSTQLHMEIYNIDDDRLDTNIDVMSEMLRELKVSDFKEFGVAPVFTDSEGRRSGNF